MRTWRHAPRPLLVEPGPRTTAHGPCEPANPRATDRRTDEYNEPSMPEPAAIEFDRVGYVQPTGARVLDNLTLGIDAGEVVALVGRSGAGKTTLLRLVNRLALPQSGRVLVDGTRHARVGSDPAAPGDRLRHPGRRPVSAHDRRRQHRRGAAARAMGRRRGSRRGSGSCSSWSGCPRRRTPGAGPRSCPAGSASASAWRARSPPIRAVLLMDEPFGALDPVTRAELQREFRGIQAALEEDGRSSSPTTCSRRWRSAHRVGVLDDGTLDRVRDARAASPTSADPRRSGSCSTPSPCGRVRRRLTTMPVLHFWLSHRAELLALIGQHVAARRASRRWRRSRSACRSASSRRAGPG